MSLFVVLDAAARRRRGDGAFGRSSQTCCGRGVRRGHVTNAAAKRFGVSIASAIAGWRFLATADLPGSDGRGSSVEPYRGASGLSAWSDWPQPM